MILKTLTGMMAVLVGFGTITSIGATALAQPESPPDSPSAVERSDRQSPDTPERGARPDGEDREGNSPRSNQRPWLGVALIDAPGGVRIGSVVMGSPASKAGLRPGDRVALVDGLEMPNSSRVIDAIAKLRPGDTVTIEVVRGGERSELRATLEVRPDSFGPGGAPLENFLPRLLRPDTSLTAEMEKMRQRIDSLEKQVKSLSRELSALRDEVAPGEAAEKKTDRIPPTAGAIDDTGF